MILKISHDFKDQYHTNFFSHCSKDWYVDILKISMPERYCKI